MGLLAITLPHIRGYDFGVGIDRLSGTAMNLVVKPNPSPPIQAEGTSQSFEVSRISSTHDLQSALGIDVNASYGCASFGAGISARFSFAQSAEVHSSTLFMAVTATVRLADLSIDECELIDAAAPVSRDDPTLFTSRYGDMFARACSRGGLFVGIMRVETFDETDSTKIEAELRGAYGLFSADASTKFSEVTKNHNASVYFKVYTEGGPDLQITDPTDPNQLLVAVQTWLKAMHDDGDHNSEPYEWTMSPVTIAEGPPPLNVEDIQNAQDVLKFCASERASLLDQLNQLNWWRRHPDRYDWTGPTTLDQVTACVTATQNDLDILADCGSDAINNAAEATFPAQYAVKHGKVGYPTAQMPQTPRAVAATPVATSSSSAGPGWKLTAVVTGGATFPPGGYVSPNGFAVDTQGRLTALPDDSPPRPLTVVPGASFVPGGYVNQLTSIGTLDELDTLMAIDTQGRFTVVCNLRAQQPPQWRAAPVASPTTFTPGGYITRPWPEPANNDVCLSVDRDGIAQAVWFSDGQQPEQAQVLPVGGATFTPGAKLTQMLEGQGTMSVLGVDSSGRLTEISMSKVQISTPTATPLTAPIFPAATSLADLKWSDVALTFAVDLQGCLTAIWRPPNQTGWQVSAVSTGGAFPPGAMVTTPARYSYRRPGAPQPTASKYTTAFAVDAQGRLNVISLRAKDTLDPPIVTPIDGSSFPGAAVLHGASQNPGGVACGLAVDHRGWFTAYSYDPDRDLWTTAAVSTQAFPPGSPISAGTDRGVAVDARGIVNRAFFG